MNGLYVELVKNVIHNISIPSKIMFDTKTIYLLALLSVFIIFNIGNEQIIAGIKYNK